MFKEFKEFALRGNVVDMAVGIIVGAAFGAIVKSLVDDVIMPPIGLLLGGVDFTNARIAPLNCQQLRFGDNLVECKVKLQRREDI